MYDRCITRGIVGSVLPVVYGNGNRIIQAPGQVVISYEMVHDTRVIYTDGRPHVGKGIRQLLGDSRGHWEGNTLVVETTNLTDKTSIGLNGNGLRHSTDMVMTERITRVGAGRTALRGRRSTIRRRTSRRSRSRCRSCRRPDTSCCRTSASKATTR